MKPLFALLLFFPLFAWAEAGLPTQPYIYVEGRAEVEKPADMVTLQFVLSFVNLDLAAANKLTQAQANKVFALLKDSGVPDADVIASDLEAEEEREEPEGGSSKRGKFLGHRVKRSFIVKVRDLKLFPKLIEDIFALKIYEFSSIREGISNEKELRDQVWEKAVANARERAEKTVKAAGAKLGAVYALSPIAFPEIVLNIFGASRPYDTMKSAIPAANRQLEPSQYRLAPVGVSQHVHAIYLIEPAK
jgi:uncharacterized protein YggE